MCPITVSLTLFCSAMEYVHTPQGHEGINTDKPEEALSVNGVEMNRINCTTAQAHGQGFVHPEV